MFLVLFQLIMLHAQSPTILLNSERESKISPRRNPCGDSINKEDALEFRRYGRATLDFENEICRLRDTMRAEHLQNLRAILDAQDNPEEGKVQPISHDRFPFAF